MNFTRLLSQAQVSLLDAKSSNLPVIVSAWSFMLRHFSEHSLYTWIFWCLLILSYFLGGGLFAMIDLLDMFPQYKIQANRKPDSKLYIRCVLQILKNYCLIIFPLSFGNFYLLRSWRGIEYSLETLPSLKTMSLEILLFFLIEDVLQYFLHRLLHYGWLYTEIHKVHHHHPFPFGLTAAYAHWAEILILAIPTYSGPLVLRPHLCTMYLWILIRELDSIHTHCGYEFPIQRWINKVLPYYGGTQFHDYHHAAFTVNFASRTTLLDKIFGTYREVSHVVEATKPPKSKRK